MVFVCVFPYFDAKKMQENKRKSWVFNFLGNHVLGEEHGEQSIIFWGRTWEKSTHSSEKIMKRKLEH